jgi:hypothetical protein
MRRRRHRPLRRAALVFAATFLALVGAGFLGMRNVEWLEFAHQEVRSVRPVARPWFPVYFRGGTHLDHLVLWNEIGPSIENARRADVLFIGSSQMQFAIPPHEIAAFEKRTGLSAFSLALPFAEGYRFPLRLIEKFDLRPRVVVANIPVFFEPAESIVGIRTIESSRWSDLMTVFEERLAERVWPLASRVLPSFVTQRPDRAILRSSQDGTWWPIHWPHHHLPVSGTEAPLAWRGRWAREFHAAMAARGTELVLTCVPSTQFSCSIFAAQPLATALKVPAVFPRVDGALYTTDVAHLCPLSGKRFGRALLRDLSRLDVVQALARERHPARLVRRGARPQEAGATP